MKSGNRSTSGQSLVEVALILVVVALAAIAILTVVGRVTHSKFAEVVNVLTVPDGGQEVEESPTILSIMADFRGLLESFYEENGHYPRSWGDYRFTDIGLDPADWVDPVEGIYWNPNGTRVGLANRAGDNIQIYVQDPDGNRLHLYDNWNIWCPAGETNCYYHSVDPENVIDLSTIEVVYTD